MTTPDISSADLQAMIDAATDGPWGLGRYTTQSVDGPDQRGICSTGGFNASWIDSEVLFLENEANARIIAAAPDLAAEVINLRAANMALVAGMAKMNERNGSMSKALSFIAGRSWDEPEPNGADVPENLEGWTDEMTAGIVEMQAAARAALSPRGQDHAG